MEKQVNSHYGEMPIIKANTPTGNVSIETKLTEGSSPNVMSTSIKKTIKLLPLIIWWDEHMVCETKLNQKIPVNQFTNSIYQYSRNQKVTEKLAGRQLIINIDQIPRTYSFHNETKAVLMMVSWTRVYLAPSGEDVKVSYTLTSNGQAVKNGIVEIKDPNKLYGIGYFKSLKNATDDYLTSYDNFYKTAGKTVLDKILAAI